MGGQLHASCLRQAWPGRLPYHPAPRVRGGVGGRGGSIAAGWPSPAMPFMLVLSPRVTCRERRAAMDARLTGPQPMALVIQAP